MTKSPEVPSQRAFRVLDYRIDEPNLEEVFVLYYYSETWLSCHCEKKFFFSLNKIFFFDSLMQVLFNSTLSKKNKVEVFINSIQRQKKNYFS